jgi:transposase-like protein
VDALRRVWTLVQVRRELRIKTPETASGGRRQFKFELKQSAVRLVMQDGLSWAEAARCVRRLTVVFRP